MKILAFDTSSTACSVALLNGEVITCSHQIAPMQQARLILPMIHSLLKASSLTLNELDALAFGCGPGSFTGVRIASSVAQGIGFAAGLPVIRISSLAVLAKAAFLQWEAQALLVAVDARMQQIYWAMYTIDPTTRNPVLQGQEGLTKPENIPIPEKNTWVGVGDGWDNYTEALAHRLGFKPEFIHSSQLPTAESLLALARVSFDQGLWVTAAEAIPVYLR